MLLRATFRRCKPSQNKPFLLSLLFLLLSFVASSLCLGRPGCGNRGPQEKRCVPRAFFPSRLPGCRALGPFFDARLTLGLLRLLGMARVAAERPKHASQKSPVGGSSLSGRGSGCAVCCSNLVGGQRGEARAVRAKHDATKQRKRKRKERKPDSASWPRGFVSKEVFRNTVARKRRWV